MTTQELMLEKVLKIAGYAGIDLTGWSLVPYNGADGEKLHANY
jgi:hypothetical protein